MQKKKGILVLLNLQGGVDHRGLLKGGAGTNIGLILLIVMVPGIMIHQVTMTRTIMLGLLQGMQLQLLLQR